MHALPKRGSLGSTLPTHWGQSALLTCSTVGNTLTSTHITVGDVPVQTWGTTLKSTKIPPTASYLCGKPTRSPRTITQPMAANYMWAVQCFRGAKVQLRPLQICPPLPHMWGTSPCLHVPPVSTFKGNLNVPSEARVHPLQPKVEDTKLQLCQTIQAQDYVFSWSVTISKHLYT